MVKQSGFAARAAVLALLCCVAGCSSSADPSNNSGGNSIAAAPAAPVAAAAAPAPAAASSPSAGPYDTSLGTGVDANGYAVLPLRSGAHRYFVNSATGSDSNGCTAAQQPTAPLRTIAAGASCIAQNANEGDQVLVAEGTTYNEGLPNVDALGGNSPTYPTVFQSYDPADATNESFYGHAANGRRPVIDTGAKAMTITCCAMTPASYVVFRGFDVNPGNVPDMGISIVTSNNLANNYFLLENNIFRYTSVGFNESGASPRADHIVVRKNAFYGEWSPTAHAQGLFISGMTGAVVEDNVFYHVGWKLGASRDDDPSIGGPTIFRHAVYQQDDSEATIRRNVFIDPSATGCSCRGNTSIQENVFIDNPISIIGGMGDNYNVAQPNGVAIDIGYNAILGDADINSMNPRGIAIWTGNGKQGSSVHNNLIVHSRNVNGPNVYAFRTDAGFDQPSYMTYDSNLVYQWSTPTFYAAGSFPAQDLVTYTNNIWDAALSGTNTNNANVSLPNPLTAAGVYAALGCADKPTCAAQMVESPEAGWAPKIRNLLWQGYSMH